MLLQFCAETVGGRRKRKRTENSENKERNMLKRKAGGEPIKFEGEKATKLTTVFFPYKQTQFFFSKYKKYKISISAGYRPDQISLKWLTR